jgi:hypothetical protein
MATGLGPSERFPVPHPSPFGVQNRIWRSQKSTSTYHMPSGWAGIEKMACQTSTRQSRRVVRAVVHSPGDQNPPPREERRRAAPHRHVMGARCRWLT